MRDTYRRNPHSFRLFCPDETNSNRLGAVFDASDRRSPSGWSPTTWRCRTTAG
jgi:phosphoketolase